MNWDADEVTKAAKALGIRLTNANWGTDIFQCWADRVMDAHYAHKAGRTERCKEMIDDANRYAI